MDEEGFGKGCAWIGTPLVRRASQLLGRCGQVIHSPSALNSRHDARFGGYPRPPQHYGKDGFSFNTKERNVWKSLVGALEKEHGVRRQRELDQTV